MTFGPTDFSGWCEQVVREGIIAKLLEGLGYEKGSKNDVLCGEQLKLEYDKDSSQATYRSKDNNW